MVRQGAARLQGFESLPPLATKAPGVAAAADAASTDAKETKQASNRAKLMPTPSLSYFPFSWVSLAAFALCGRRQPHLSLEWAIEAGIAPVDCELAVS
jgi:hypothetical protein